VQNLSPEERTRMLEQMRAKGVDPTAWSGREGSPSRAQTPETASQAAARRRSATTIDALFGPLPAVETAGRVWRYENKQLIEVRVRLGISDGQATELIAGDLEPGVQLVTSVSTGQEARPAVTGPGAFSPFMGPGAGRFGSPRGGTNGGRGR
jgi:hypothetical protein